MRQSNSNLSEVLEVNCVLNKKKTNMRNKLKLIFYHMPPFAINCQWNMV